MSYEYGYETDVGGYPNKQFAVASSSELDQITLE
jgi:hypothetical protein